MQANHIDVNESNQLKPISNLLSMSNPMQSKATLLDNRSHHDLTNVIMEMHQATNMVNM